jgi:hypothetical protein
MRSRINSARAKSASENVASVVVPGSKPFLLNQTSGFRDQLRAIKKFLLLIILGCISGVDVALSRCQFGESFSSGFGPDGGMTLSFDGFNRVAARRVRLFPRRRTAQCLIPSAP